MHYLLNLGVFIRLFALINRHQGYPFFLLEFNRSIYEKEFFSIEIFATTYCRILNAADEWILNNESIICVK